MSSNCSTSLALSRAEMLLVCAAHAEFVATHVPFIVSRHNRVARFESLLPSRCTIVSGPFAVVLSKTWQCDASMVLNSTSERYTESVPLSHLSVLSTMTSIVSPSSDRACIHKCRSDMKCRQYHLSLLPSQFLGMRSLIRYGLDAAGCAGTFRSAVLMLLNMSILPLTDCCIASAISCLNCC